MLFMDIIITGLLSLIVQPMIAVGSLSWKDSGDVRYALNCEFYGNDLRSQSSRSEKCGPICISDRRCSHFTWSTYNKGTCWLKRGGVQENAAQEKLNQSLVCGYVKIRSNEADSKQKGTTTRYWDCCKPSCSWPRKGPANPVATCSANGVDRIGNNQASGCNNGPSFPCSNHAPWVINDKLAYGFAAFGYGSTSPCCKCFKLDFTSGSVVGKSMIVQVTNSGGDLDQAQFNLAIPGGGVGFFNGCEKQWGAPSDGWGDRYGGIHNVDECSQLPWQLQEGCKWRFRWFQGADNPTVDWAEVDCPSELAARTGCYARNSSTPAEP